MARPPCPVGGSRVERISVSLVMQNHRSTETSLDKLGGGGEVQPNGCEPKSLLLALLRDGGFFGVAGVQEHREEAGPGLATRIPGYPVDGSRRLVERIPGLVFFDRLVVEGVLVVALQDVAEHRAGMVVR